MKLLGIAWIALFWGSAAGAKTPEIAVLVEVGPEGKGNAAAAAAWSKLAGSADAGTLLELLEAMDGAGPVAANWLRSAAEVIADKLHAKDATPLAPLGKFLTDRSHNARARRLAFELIAKAAPDSAAAMIPSFLDDPSPELRRDAVAQLMTQAAAAEASDAKAAVKFYQEALSGAVEPAQVKPIAEALGKLGTPVDLPRHFGFLMRWHVVGPFDNTGRAGFEKAQPLESGTIDVKAPVMGVDGELNWKPLATADSFGKVDLNKPFGMLKERLAYAYTEYESKSERSAELRIGTKNAFKVWLNGELVFARDEYHRGQRIDQYILPVQLKAGTNTILVKACQNEQKEEWTVQWEFQLRICDSTGSAILSENRLPTPKPENPRPRRGAK